MSIVKKEVKVKTYQRKNGYPLGYYASQKEINDPKFRSASPASSPTEFGTFRNGRITSMRVSTNES
jgi:hypothetical protein